MNGYFKSIIIDKDTVIKQYENIFVNNNIIGIAIENKEITQHDVRIVCWFPHGRELNITTSYKDVSGYQKRGTW